MVEGWGDVVVIVIVIVGCLMWLVDGNKGGCHQPTSPSHLALSLRLRSIRHSLAELPQFTFRVTKAKSRTSWIWKEPSNLIRGASFAEQRAPKRSEIVDA